MSFSADWLTLREPADHAARNKGILSLVADYFYGKQVVNITDIGCGTGSNLRGMFHALPPLQNWLLVDYDEKLLTAAREKLSEWADAVLETSPFVIQKSDKIIEITFLQADLNKQLNVVLGYKTDLLTAAAFFDLCSKQWINGLVTQLKLRNIAFYTTLTYDGIEEWSPSHSQDAAALATFHAHQKTDKGFGLSEGPKANQTLMEAFEKVSYQNHTGKSPWIITEKQLMNALLNGSFNALEELKPKAFNEWKKQHERATQLIVSHDDLFAFQHTP